MEINVAHKNGFQSNRRVMNQLLYRGGGTETLRRADDRRESHAANSDCSATNPPLHSPCDVITSSVTYSSGEEDTLREP